MNPKSQQPMEWHRILFGELPASFLFEIATRGVLIYLLLLVSMRILGRRVAAQLSVPELAVVVTLGAAVGVPMQSPERGLLPAIILLGIAIAFQRGTNRWAYSNRRVELITQGDVVTVVRDGILDLEVMKRTVLSRDRLYAALRASGIEQLGQLRRVYLESSGQFSIFRAVPSRPGLSILPLEDEHGNGNLQDPVEHHQSCNSCGFTSPRPLAQDASCPHCGARAWLPSSYQREDPLPPPGQQQSEGGEVSEKQKPGGAALGASS